MQIEQSYSLLKHNTFGIDAQCDWFVHYESEEDLNRLVSDEFFQQCRMLHIGEGSNLLFLTNFHGIVLHSGIVSVDLLEGRGADGKQLVRVGGGAIWDEVVDRLVEMGLWGAENLSLIPGSMGAAAVQNIGAYGVEVQDIIHEVETMHRRTGEKRTFLQSECGYSYRHSIFKDPEYADYIVTYVTLALSETPNPRLEYKDLSNYFALHRGSSSPSLREIRDGVVAIRRSKLPDPQEVGNAGSYFMNPIVGRDRAITLMEQYPEMPHYPQTDGGVKLAAAWLIDQCGYRGAKRGRVGVYEKQALVLVNLGGATGQEVATLAEEIIEAVEARFGIRLAPEVRYIS